MRYFLILVTIFLLLFGDAHGLPRRHRYRGPARTEVELMNNVLECLHYKDTGSYYNLFPPFDTLWKMVMHNPDQSPEVLKELAQLKEHPTVLIDQDPYYNGAIIGRFAAMLKKGEDSGIHWDGLIIQRYELQKQGISRGMEGLQRIAPERFKGFLFVRDLLSSTTYCITITEIQKINGFFFGGQVLNVLEAKTIDEYLRKDEAEQQYYAKLDQEARDFKPDSVHIKDSLAARQAYLDSVKNDSPGIASSPVKKLTLPVDTAKAKRNLLLSVNGPADEDPNKTRKEVVDRKYYAGKFDEEIPVKLYIRYMKDGTGKVSNWEALYKFGDMEQYVKLDVSKSDGKWEFEEPVASMELELENKTYTGTWTNGGSQTGYDVVLTQKEISDQKIKELDKILETGTWGRSDDQPIKEKEIPKKDYDDNQNNPDN